MSKTFNIITRRSFLKRSLAIAAGIVLSRAAVFRGAEAITAMEPIKQRIPSSGEKLPVIGMGSSGTFDVGSDPATRAELTGVIKTLFGYGGKVIDTSPMYGRAEEVIGDLLKVTGLRKDAFIATKVWTDGREAGIEQMKRSMALLGTDVIDLMQIHNLRDWKTHLPVLREWKSRGIFRYIGITTSDGRLNDEFARIMRSETLDFAQFTYNIADREPEKDLLPIASDRGIAVLINRPFRRNDLFDRVRGKPLPDWADEFDCRSWGQFFLKFIVSHPSVTCVIPATANPGHMKDDMGAGIGRLPDAAMRAKMARYFDSL